MISINDSASSRSRCFDSVAELRRKTGIVFHTPTGFRSRDLHSLSRRPLRRTAAPCNANSFAVLQAVSGGIFVFVTAQLRVSYYRGSRLGRMPPCPGCKQSTFKTTPTDRGHSEHAGKGENSFLLAMRWHPRNGGTKRKVASRIKAKGDAFECRTQCQMILCTSLVGVD